MARTVPGRGVESEGGKWPRSPPRAPVREATFHLHPALQYSQSISIFSQQRQVTTMRRTRAGLGGKRGAPGEG